MHIVSITTYSNYSTHLKRVALLKDIINLDFFKTTHPMEKNLNESFISSEEREGGDFEYTPE